MISIKVTDTDKSEHLMEVEPNPSSNLMVLLTAKNMDVAAICGGMAGCGTCQVAFDKGFEKLDDLEEDEEFMLDTLDNREKTSRLSCQVALTDLLDGAEIRVLGDGS
ncbi:MAG: 2Fe-2S iron-sulfur cluster-binding protein [Bacteroidota bacterium]